MPSTRRVGTAVDEANAFSITAAALPAAIVHRGCALERRNDVRVVERAPHQQTRIDAIDGGANDRCGVSRSLG